MANKHSFKDEKNRKKKKSRKHKKEKHKKHKKEKPKFKRDSSESNGSDSRVSLQDVKLEKSNRVEWDFLDAALSDSHVSLKNKKEKRKSSPETPYQHVRELNPYWKDGGCGLPPIVEEKSRISKSALGNDFSSTFRGNYLCCIDKINNKEDAICYNKQSKTTFLKPVDESDLILNRSPYQGNWKKKKVEDLREVVVVDDGNNKNKNNETLNETKLLYNEELNRLASKLVKAEIMGNTSLVNKLKAELEAAKKAKNESEVKREEIVIVTDRNIKKSYDKKQNDVPSKRQKVNTHDSKGRVCYFPDDDKYSLKNLFEKEKRFTEEEIIFPSKLAGKNQDELDDIFLVAAASNKIQQKLDEKKNKKAMKEALVKHKTLEGCNWCLENRNKTKHLIMSTGSKCYLCLPEEESLSAGHCLVVPIQHEISAMHVDEDVWNEIKTYQKVLTQMFFQEKKDVVFFENARSFKHFPHCVIHCVPLSKELGDEAPIYFQKAISESETEWSNNKKLIDFRQKDLRRVIPKGLPYFAVSFGTEGGFAHIIEDEFLFKKNFAEEILGGMLDLEPQKWRKPQKQNFSSQREKALEFLKMWKKFEFNKGASDSDSCSSD